MRWTKTIAWCGIASALAVLPRRVPGQDASVKPTPKSATSAAVAERDWWKNAVIYEIYPRSFQDSNGDGIGDLNGITERLDYLKQLGVNAIWLTPVYPSPQVDFGYDISDYKNIDPQYGTLADFDGLVAEARKRHIRVLMDMVINHTSTEHEWFLQSRSSRENPYRDWYIWRDGKGQTATDKGSPPTNWQSDMGHSAWAWDEKTRQWYYHRFYEIFRQRKYRLRLLSAAFRNHMHWSEFIGRDVVISPPYSWQLRFNASDIEIRSRIDDPVQSRIVEQLLSKFADFRAAYTEDGLSINEFDSFAPTRRTLRQFIAACSDLNAIVRDVLIPNPELPGSTRG